MCQRDSLQEVPSGLLLPAFFEHLQRSQIPDPLPENLVSTSVAMHACISLAGVSYIADFEGHNDQVMRRILGRWDDIIAWMEVLHVFVMGDGPLSWKEDPDEPVTAVACARIFQRIFTSLASMPGSPSERLLRPIQHSDAVVHLHARIWAQIVPSEPHDMHEYMDLMGGWTALLPLIWGPPVPLSFLTAIGGVKRMTRLLIDAIKIESTTTYAVMEMG